MSSFDLLDMTTGALATPPRACRDGNHHRGQILSIVVGVMIVVVLPLLLKLEEREREIGGDDVHEALTCG